MLLVIPLLAVVALSGLRLDSVLSDMRQAGRAEQVATVVQDMTALVDELQAERDLTGAYLGTQRAVGGDELATERQRVDSALDAYRKSAADLDGDFGPVVADRLQSIGARLDGIAALREAADKGLSPWPSISGDYSETLSQLIGLEEGITQGSDDPQLLQGARALSALSRTKELLSQERGTLGFVFGAKRFEGTGYRDFVNLDARYLAAQDQLHDALSGDQRDLYDRKVSQTTAVPVNRIRENVLADPQGRNLAGSENWYNTALSMLESVRQVETELASQVLDRASALRDDARQQAALDAGIVLAVLVVTVLLGLFVMQSLVRPLRRLSGAATSVALELPGRVRRLRSAEPGEVDARVEPMRVTSSDEVGEVALAFNAVHREAVRVAVEQSLLRKNVSTMFINLSRRTQGLVERQLRLIDDLEGNEDNSGVLGELFQLDHLATRMRRNADNLLVLAGSDSGRKWNRPVSLLDVLRAAAAEVEQYPRVAQTYVTEREVDGRAVGDVVHLVSELLENALEFSSPETQVVLSARSLPGDAGVMVQIEDRGIGMSEEELGIANERLSTSTELDVSLSRMMGLYVVGKLAARHEIRVQLAHSAVGGGVVAMIHLPSTVVLDDQGVPRAEPLGAPPIRVRPPLEPVGFGAPVDLGDHETRPIFDNRARPRPFPRQPDEDYEDEPVPEEVPVSLSVADFDAMTPVSVNGVGPHPPEPAGPPAPSASPPALMDPALMDPALMDPAPMDPAPMDPALMDSALMDPAPMDPVLMDPVLMDPASGDQAPMDLVSNATMAPPQPGRPGQPGGSGPSRPSGPHGPSAPHGPSGPSGPHGPSGPPSPSGSPPGLSGPPAGPPPVQQVQPAQPAPPPAPPAEFDATQPVDIAEVLSGTRGAAAPRVPAEPAAAGAGAAASSGENGGGEEYLPIYAQVESEWFRRRTRPEPAMTAPGPSAQAGPAGHVGPSGHAGPAGQAGPHDQSAQAWHSVADDGWRAAEQVAKPRSSGTTKAGLPVRMPQAHYVPGSAGAPRPAAGPRAGQAPPVRRGPQREDAGERTPEAVRGLLSNYHRGLRQGREAGRHRSDGENRTTEQ